MLRMTKIELEIISNLNLFVEKVMRAGISYIAKSYSKDNNEQMKPNDDSKRSIYVSYFDTINLNGWEISQNLPNIELKCLNLKKMINLM